jgi:hypothetical protein
MTIMRRLGRYTAAADGQHPGGELDVEDAQLGQLAPPQATLDRRLQQKGATGRPAAPVQLGCANRGRP